MNAPLLLEGIVSALTPAIPRLSDLIEFARKSWPHLEWTAAEIYQLRPHHSIADAKIKLGNFKRREALKKDMRHWSYCPNRDVTTRQFLALIEQFEAAEPQRRGR